MVSLQIVSPVNDDATRQFRKKNEAGSLETPNSGFHRIAVFLDLFQNEERLPEEGGGVGGEVKHEVSWLEKGSKGTFQHIPIKEN
jgi:hypothetical protein